MQREHWRFIKGYSKRYQVSDRGRVRNSRHKILSTNTNSNGCVRVTLYACGDRYMHSVAKLVKDTFK